MSLAAPEQFVFTDQDLILSPQSPYENYRQRSDQEKKAIYWGQRKLLISEIEFFSLYLDTETPALCVYVGAAHGYHIPILSSMFPMIQFHLFDKGEHFKIKESDKIKIIPRYFDDNDAISYKGQNVYFLSDIRRRGAEEISGSAQKEREDALKLEVSENLSVQLDGSGNPMGSLWAKEGFYKAYKEALAKSNLDLDMELEKDIWEDMESQQRWLFIMDPKEAFLKLRLPYQYPGSPKESQYLKGIVYWQMWARAGTSETRLKPVRNNSGEYELGTWNNATYEGVCFYQNARIREAKVYLNPFTGKLGHIDHPELLNDFDSTGEVFILNLYRKRLFPNYPVDFILDLSRTITSFLNYFRPKTSIRHRAKKQRKVDAFAPKTTTKTLSMNLLEAPSPVITNARIIKPASPKFMMPEPQLNIIVNPQIQRPIQQPSPLIQQPSPPIQQPSPPTQQFIPIQQPSPPVQQPSPPVQQYIPIQRPSPPIQQTAPINQLYNPTQQTYVPVSQQQSTPAPQTYIPQQSTPAPQTYIPQQSTPVSQTYIPQQSTPVPQTYIPQQSTSYVSQTYTPPPQQQPAPPVPQTYIPTPQSSYQVPPQYQTYQQASYQNYQPPPSY